MGGRLRILLMIPALAATGAAGAGTQGGTADARQTSRPVSLCAADETILFQCRTGMKLVSLCGRGGPAPAVRFLHGNPGRIDYASPADAAFSYRRDGIELNIGIRDGEREHHVYSLGRGGGLSADGRLDSGATDGVMMDQGGPAHVERRCASEATRRGRVEDFMPEGIEE